MPDLPGNHPSWPRPASTHLCTHGDTQGALHIISQRIQPHGQGSLGSQHSGHLALELGGCLPHQAGVVDQAVLGRVVLGLEGPEQRLLCPQNLQADEV